MRLGFLFRSPICNLPPRKLKSFRYLVAILHQSCSVWLQTTHACQEAHCKTASEQVLLLKRKSPNNNTTTCTFVTCCSSCPKHNCFYEQNGWDCCNRNGYTYFVHVRRLVLGANTFQQTSPLSSRPSVAATPLGKHGVVTAWLILVGLHCRDPLQDIFDSIQLFLTERVWQLAASPKNWFNPCVSIWYD